MGNTIAAPRFDGYQLRLPMFEGPLDVLLRLIEREQLAISEVSLLTVLDQFMAYASSLRSPPPDTIAEFAAVAGRLSLLKSRALLPRPSTPDDEPDEADLVRQLEEYRAVKAAAELLAQRQRSGSGIFGRGDAVAAPEAEPPRLAPQPPGALAKAVRRWFSRLPEKPAIIPGRRVVTLREMIERIVNGLAATSLVRFAAIRETCESRQDVAVAFLAVLTLLRRQMIAADQESLFGEILISRRDRDQAAGESGHARRA